MNIIVFDTETTGLPSPRLDLSLQPYICQFAALIVEIDLDTRSYRETRKISQLIKPLVSIPQECTHIHGISDKDVKNMPTFSQIVDKLLNLFQNADIAVAHNLNFDQTIIENELLRLNKPKKFLPERIYDTMEAMKDVLKIPGRGGGYKSPNMQEVYQHFYGERFKDAHNALNDVLALSKALKAMFREGIFNPEPISQESLF